MFPTLIFPSMRSAIAYISSTIQTVISRFSIEIGVIVKYAIQVHRMQSELLLHCKVTKG